MVKRLQIALTDETWDIVEKLTKEATENFDVGSIGFSDVVNEMILNAKIDIKSLQLKHTNVKRFVRNMASNEDLDLDGMIKNLTELKLKSSRRQKATNTNSEGEA